jgi:hypothetical protein
MPAKPVRLARSISLAGMNTNGIDGAGENVNSLVRQTSSIRWIRVNVDNSFTSCLLDISCCYHVDVVFVFARRTVSIGFAAM